MLIIIIALVLIFFWVSTIRITPEQFPTASTENLLAWKINKLSLYRRYAGFFVIYILLAFCNGALGHYVLTYKKSGIWYTAFETLTVINAAYILIFIGFTARNAYNNFKLKQALLGKTTDDH